MNDETTPTNLQRNQDQTSLRFFLSIFARFLFWIAFLILVPLLLLPRCQRMFEEFGIAVPKLTQLAFAIGDGILSVSLSYAVVVITALVAWQLVLLFFKRQRMGSMLLFVDWVLISCAAVILVITLGIPIVAIVSGISS